MSPEHGPPEAGPPGQRGALSSLRLEARLIPFFSAAWIAGLLRYLDWLPALADLAPPLYPLYSAAAALGWVAGNVYVARRRRLPWLRGRWLRTFYLTSYLLAPPGAVYLWWSFHPAEVLRAAPLVPIYAFGVYAVLFAVPVLLKPPVLKSPRLPSAREEVSGEEGRRKEPGDEEG